MTYDAAPDPSARQGRKTVNESQDTPLSEGSWQPFLTVNVCGRDWTLERAADMEALWESMTEFTEDERLPTGCTSGARACAASPALISDAGSA